MSDSVTENFLLVPIINILYLGSLLLVLSFVVPELWVNLTLDVFIVTLI
jgi:uncharacterized metal-binding protein